MKTTLRKLVIETREISEEEYYQDGYNSFIGKSYATGQDGCYFTYDNVTEEDFITNPYFRKMLYNNLPKDLRFIEQDLKQWKANAQTIENMKNAYLKGIKQKVEDIHTPNKIERLRQDGYRLIQREFYRYKKDCGKSFYTVLEEDGEQKVINYAINLMHHRMKQYKIKLTKEEKESFLQGCKDCIAEDLKQIEEWKRQEREIEEYRREMAKKDDE